MRKSFVPATLLLLTLLFGLANAASADDTLYSASVPLADTSAGARDQAFAQALGAVLGHLTGDPTVVAQPGVVAALKNASALVQQYRYVQAAAGGTLSLAVSFDPGALRRLARDLALPIWPGPRPPVLAVLTGANGTPLTAAQAAPLLAAGSDRGIGFVLPAAGAPAPDATALALADPTALAAAAAQYHTGLVLVGQLGAARADWALIIGGQAQTWQGRGGDASAQLGDGAATAARRLAQRFAAAPAAVTAQQATLWVSGLQSALDYATLIGTLRRDPRVRGLRPLQAQGDGLLLGLDLDVPLGSISDDLVASGRLVPAAAHPGAALALRWVH